MKNGIFTIISNENIARDVYKMTLHGDCSDITRPGQFVNIALEGKYLRRPISVCDCEGDRLTLIYKTVGGGTLRLSGMETGETLDLLTGLGNGFELDTGKVKPLLIGGGVGVPPLYLLAKKLLERDVEPAIVLGFNSADEVFFRDEFKALGIYTYLATADGSAGYQGFVTDVIKRSFFTYDYFYACGPMPMLRAVCETCCTDGQLSFEERMGCGFGACVGCTCRTKYGDKRICRDGPVLKKGEIIW